MINFFSDNPLAMKMENYPIHGLVLYSLQIGELSNFCQFLEHMGFPQNNFQKYPQKSINTNELIIYYELRNIKIAHYCECSFNFF